MGPLVSGLLLWAVFIGGVLGLVWLMKAAIRRVGVSRSPIEGRIAAKRTITVNFGKGSGIVRKLDVDVNGKVRPLDVLEPRIFHEVREGERVRLWVALNTVVQAEPLDSAPVTLTPKEWELHQRRLRRK